MTIHAIVWKASHEPISPWFGNRGDLLRWVVDNMPSLREWALGELG